MSSPAIIPRILHIIIFLGFLGFLVKLYKPSESNMLFDGASLVLYTVAVVVYITNVVKGFRIVSAGGYDVGGDVVPGEEPLGRIETLRVLAASNTILALVLVGVLVLQAGQWYAEQKEADELEKMEAEEAEEKAAATSSSSSAGGKNVKRTSSNKKKQ
ncbi:hypothetical protein FGG08_003895 [Glutinoglossum americanum]|uniref:Shr3 amino acid permease chaperone n=1 Tax=Glutinoglossum americanum TaxID=1670608 RepID=A0A9P8I684_9PEZI|nr:hypothetical protein FGG08_003895 [Glutinoglossum americanum]